MRALRLRFFSTQKASAFPSTKKANFSIHLIRGALLVGFTGVSIITYNSYFKQSSSTSKDPSKMRPLPPVDHLKSMDEVTMIFKKNETAFHSPQRDFHFDLNSIPSNNPMEDYHSQHCTKYGMVYGVFDGHGGPECGAIVSKLLASYIDHQLCKVPVSAETGLPAKENVIKGIKQAFLDLDKDICLGSLSIDQPSVAKPSRFLSYLWSPMASKASMDYKKILEGLKIAGSGSCAIITYLQGNEVYVANTGDCRTVMGRSMVFTFPFFCSLLILKNRGTIINTKQLIYRKTKLPKVLPSLVECAKNILEKMRRLLSEDGFLVDLCLLELLVSS
jgi:hypothetical protein